MAYQAKIDTDEVRAALHLLVEDTFEIRVFGLQSPRDSSAYGTYSAYFDASQIDKAASMVGRLTYRKGAKSAGVYLTLNPVHPALKYRAGAEWMNCGATKDEDVLRRRWFPVDIDPSRIVDGREFKGIPASEEERSAAARVSEGVWRYLIDEQGWPSCVLADSGNGSHALWRIDEPNDEATRDLIKDALAYLAQRFGTDAVDIDTTVYNAARIWKLYGTTGAKGSSTPERPHRRGKVLSTGSLDPYAHPALVTRAQLEALAALYVPEVAASKAKKKTAKKSTPGARPDPIRGEFDLEAWMDRYGLELSKVSAKGNGILYELAECPWHGLAHARKAWVHHRQDGVKSHGCQGGRCQSAQPELSWKLLRAHYEPEYAERQRAHLRLVKDPAPEQETQQEKPEEETRAGVASRLTLNREGLPKNLLTNIGAVLCLDERWRDVLAFDELALTVVARKAPPWGTQEASARGYEQGQQWRDGDDNRLRVWLHREYEFEPTRSLVREAVDLISERNAIHPVREWLRSLKGGSAWAQPDSLLNTWLVKYAGVEDTPYARKVGRWWLIGAVARVHPPRSAGDEGVKMDNVLVLEGEQGQKKSTLFRLLLPQERWFADSRLAIGEKDGLQSLRGTFIYELAELDGYTSRRDESAIKAFLTSKVDDYRPSYGARNVRLARQCVFCATANKSEYFKDETGNRRFWPAKVEGAIDIDALVAARGTLWAQAVAAYDARSIWWPDTPFEHALCAEQQLSRLLGDAWEGAVRAWLATRFASWHTYPVDGSTLNREGWIKSQWPTTQDILTKAIGLELAKQGNQERSRVVKICAALGFGYAQRRRAGIRGRFFIPRDGTLTDLCPRPKVSEARVDPPFEPY